MNATHYSSKSRCGSIHFQKFNQKIDNIIETITSVQSRKDIIIPHNLAAFQPLNLQELVQSSRATAQTSRSNCQSKRFISPSQSRNRLYSRKTEVSPQISLRSSMHRKLLRQHEILYAEYLQSSNLPQAFNQLVEMIIVDVEQDNFQLLITHFRLVALTFITFKDFQKALIFLDHCRFLSEFMRRFDVIQWAFLQMGYICKYLKRIDQAKIFVKKSIEYAWQIQDIEQELLCYEELGKLCYLSYELDHAKALHDKSSQGTSEPSNSQMRTISSRGLQQVFQNLPQKASNLDKFVLSKSVNFPFRIITNSDPQYYQDNYVKNQYLISLELECVPSNRILDIELTIDEILGEILKGDNFIFEIPLPIPSNFKELANKETTTLVKSRSQKLKETQMLTFIKLAANRKLSIQSDHHKANTFKLDFQQKKLPLQILIEQRLQKQNELLPSFSHCQKLRRFNNNLDHIRINNEQAVNREHTKKGLLRYAQRLLNIHDQNQKTNFTSVVNLIQNSAIIF